MFSQISRIPDLIRKFWAKRCGLYAVYGTLFIRPGEILEFVYDERAHDCKCLLRHRLHGRGFLSKRFHDLETEWKTIRFQRVYTEPIQPLNPTVYVKAISFSGLCASSVGSKFDQTQVRRLSSPRPNPESSFSFSLRYSAGAYRRKSQHFKTSLPVAAVWLSVYSKIHESCKSEVKPQIKVARFTIFTFHIYFAPDRF